MASYIPYTQYYFYSIVQHYVHCIIAKVKGNSFYYITCFHRTGKAWRDVRSKHGKQATLENVHTYIPGLIQATQRLLRNITEASNKDDWINDLHPLICNWSMEGSLHVLLNMTMVSHIYSFSLFYTWC